jgi:hypothetical protein
MTDRRRTAVAVAAAALALAACGGAPPPPSTAEAQLPATLQSGDVTIRASTVPTLQLGAAAAEQYGIPRDGGTILLLVGVRLGVAEDTSLPARVTASATDLLGRRQDIALREVRSGGFIDYAGTATLSPPETLRFDIVVERDGAPRESLRFTRDFFP